MQVINESRFVYVVAKGQPKKDMIKQVFDLEHKSSMKLPISMISHNAKWLLTADAVPENYFSDNFEH